MAARSGSIAVVDDDPVLVEGLARLVRSFGHDATTFTSAAALLSADVAAFDCVVSDIVMPGMGGLALLASLRARRRALPVILLTAFVDPAMRSVAMRAGAVCVLPKPFDDEELSQSIDVALRNGPPRRHDGTFDPRSDGG